MIRILAFLLALTMPAIAMDHGFPKGTERSKFFQLLKRPDKYPDSCCGEADAYEVDIDKHNPDGSYDVVITEDTKQFPDGSYRTPIPGGTKFHVPENKVNPPKETMYNPTGQSWLFVTWYSGKVGTVFCLAPIPEGS